MADPTITEQIVREAPDIEAYKTGLLSSGKSLVDAASAAAAQGQYLTPSYQVAGLSPDQLAAIQLGQQGIGAYQPYLYGAGQSLGYGQNVIGSGIGALQGSAQMYNPWMAQSFMNPYQQQVIDESLRQINRQTDIARQGVQSQATRSGAFGGSRAGIQQAELERNAAEQRNAAIVGGLYQGYQGAAQQAQQAFEAQQARQQALGQGLGSLGTQQANIGMQQAALGQQAQALGQQDVNMLYNLGTSQQQQLQAQLDAQRQNLYQQNMQPYQQLAFLSDIYKGAPSSQMSSTSLSATTPSPFQQIAGLGIAGVSAAAAANKAGIL